MQVRSLSVVIPVHDEDESVAQVHRELEKVLEDLGVPYEVVFVDDGSVDETFSRLCELLKFGNVKIIRLRRNFGQTAGLGIGMKQAAGDVIVTMDGDLQNDPRDIPKVLAEMERGYDAVSGWRVNRLDSLGKRISSRISNWLARRLTHLRLHDFGCTLKAYSRESVKALHFHGDAHRYLPAFLHARGFRVGEVQVGHRPRKHGHSKYGIARLFRGVSDLLSLKLWLLYESRPSHLFGFLALLSIIAGLSVGGYLVFLRFAFNESLSDKPLLLLAILLVLIGLQFFSLGFLAEMLIRRYPGESGDERLAIREIRTEPRIPREQDRVLTIDKRNP